MREKDFPGYSSKLGEIKEQYPEQKFVVFTDYDDAKLELLQRDWHLMEAEIIDLRESANF